MGTWEYDLGRPRPGGDIGDQNFDAHTHKRLYENIHSGPGYPAAQTAEDSWTKLSDTMRTARVELERAIRQSSAVWRGAAGQQFTSSNAPLLQWAEDARAAAMVTRASIRSQAESYLDAKGRMPEPVEVTSTANDDFWGIPSGLAHLVGGQTDQDLQEARAQEAKRLAVAVMNGYRDRAAAAVASLGEFVPPPSVTTQVVEPTAVEPTAVELDEVQQTETVTPSRKTPDRDEPGYVEPGGATATESHDVDRTGASAVTTTQATPSAPTRGAVTVPASPPPTPVDASLANRPPIPISRFSSGRTAGHPGGATEGGAPRGAGGGPRGRAGGGTGGGIGGGGARPALPGGDPATPAPGPGRSTGTGTDTPANRTTSAPARGATAGSHPVGLAGAPPVAKDEEDREHRTAPYLEELDDVWGEDGIPRVAPPVIGEDDR